MRSDPKTHDEQCPCTECGRPTRMTGTKLCDRCWEESRPTMSDEIKRYSPHLKNLPTGAQRMVMVELPGAGAFVRHEDYKARIDALEQEQAGSRLYDDLKSLLPTDENGETVVPGDDEVLHPNHGSPTNEIVKQDSDWYAVFDDGFNWPRVPVSECTLVKEADDE